MSYSDFEEGYKIPNYMDRNGSLLLRSDQKKYSRNVFVTGWHAAREAEPKDYDLSKDPVRDLKIATYKHIAAVTDVSTPETVYQDSYNAVKLKKQIPMHSVLNIERPMFSMEQLKYSHLERDTGDPQEGFFAVLPRKESFRRRENPGFDPFEPVPEIPPDYEDKSPAFRKCLSQFTDTSNHRRPGRNTWRDESGIYTNTHFKRQVFVPHDPIPKRLI